MKKNSFCFIKGILVFSFIFFVSCQQKNNEIEIYLLNKRILSSEGIPLSNVRKIKKFENIYDKFNDDTNYDTISKKFIFGGKFEVESNQLQETPFILGSEIKSIDTLKGLISFSKSASDKIRKLKPNMINGQQFAICINKKVVFTGYFWSEYSSYLGTWNCLYYDHLNNSKSEFYLHKCNGMNAEKTKIDFSKYSDLLR